MIWLIISCGLMVITAVAHSALSEIRLVPALPETGLARTIIRYALHAMSVFMLLSAVTVVWPGMPPILLAIIGLGWIAVGLSGLIVSRGKHVGWPVITGAGLAALAGAFL